MGLLDLPILPASNAYLPITAVLAPPEEIFQYLKTRHTSPWFLVFLSYREGVTALKIALE